MASFEEFKVSAKGQKIEAILMNHDQQVRMECLAEFGLPVAMAVGKPIEAAVGDLENPEKQHVGRWIRDILATKGWQPVSKGRVAEGNLFSRAAIYAPIKKAE